MYKIGDYIQFSEYGKQVFNGFKTSGIYKIIEVDIHSKYPYKIDYDGFAEGFAVLECDEIELVDNQMRLPFRWNRGANV